MPVFGNPTNRLFSPQIRAYNTASGSNILKGGFEYIEAKYNVEFYWYSDSGTNTITITASGGQTVVSADAAITLSKVGSCAVLKKVAASSWILTGGLA